MRRSPGWAFVPLSLCLLWIPQLSMAQSQSREMINYQPLASLNSWKELPCGWNYYWDPPDRYAEVDVQLTLSDSGRSWSGSTPGLFGYLSLTVAVDATYLPTTNYLCGSAGAVLNPIFYFPWEYAQDTWTNPTCTGHAGPQSGRTPTDAVSYGFDANVLGSDWQNMRNGWTQGGDYWPAVGNSPSVYMPSMNTPIGGDRLILADPTLPATVPARHDYPTATFRVNPAFKGEGQGFWAVVGAHELGHALNSDHCPGGNPGNCIMYSDIAGASTSLTPRDLDKCWIVRHLPANIRTQ